MADLLASLLKQVAQKQQKPMRRKKELVDIESIPIITSPTEGKRQEAEAPVKEMKVPVKVRQLLFLLLGPPAKEYGPPEWVEMEEGVNKEPVVKPLVTKETAAIHKKYGISEMEARRRLARKLLGKKKPPAKDKGEEEELQY